MHHQGCPHGLTYQPDLFCFQLGSKAVELRYVASGFVARDIIGTWRATVPPQLNDDWSTNLLQSRNVVVPIRSAAQRAVNQEGDGPFAFVDHCMQMFGAHQ